MSRALLLLVCLDWSRKGSSIADVPCSTCRSFHGFDDGGDMTQSQYASNIYSTRFQTWRFCTHDPFLSNVSLTLEGIASRQRILSSNPCNPPPSLFFSNRHFFVVWWLRWQSLLRLEGSLLMPSVAFVLVRGVHMRRTIKRDITLDIVIKVVNWL